MRKPVHALIMPHGTVSDPLTICTAVETSKAVSLPVTNPAEDGAVRLQHNLVSL
jgi:hypothetical protein